MNLISDEQIIKVMRHYNPWWQNPSAIRNESRTCKRTAYDKVLEVLAHSTPRYFVMLSGARCVGKTTVLYQIIEHLMDKGVQPQQILYVSFDNPMLKFVSLEDLLSTYTLLHPAEGFRYLFLDEVQYAQDFTQWTRRTWTERKDLWLMAARSANPVLEEDASDLWKTIHLSTLSFYEYCRLLSLKTPRLPDNLKLTALVHMPNTQLSCLMDQFSLLCSHFHRFLKTGGFPTLVLSKDDPYVQNRLREEIADKVIKEDLFSLFQIRSPLMMEKLLVYLCLHSAGTFSITRAAKDLDSISVPAVENYLDALERSNLIHIVSPADVGGKGALKGRPKIFMADTAIRNAVLMIDMDDVLSSETEQKIAVEMAVHAQMASFDPQTLKHCGYFRKARNNQKEVDLVIDLPGEKILCDVQYCQNSRLCGSAAIVELCNDEEANVTSAFLITKQLEDFGVSDHQTKVPIFKIPAIAFLYLLGKAEADGQNG